MRCRQWCGSKFLKWCFFQLKRQCFCAGFLQPAQKWQQGFTRDYICELAFVFSCTVLAQPAFLYHSQMLYVELVLMVGRSNLWRYAILWTFNKGFELVIEVLKSHCNLPHMLHSTTPTIRRLYSTKAHFPTPVPLSSLYYIDVTRHPNKVTLGNVKLTKLT